HDQCHAVALSNLTLKNGNNAADSAIGALQQVSGNQISTQGSLATRVSAGQFGNITGRLSALRFGAGATLSHWFTAHNQGSAEPFGSGTQVFALDRSALQDMREDGCPVATILPSASSPWGGDLIRTGYGNGESNRAAKSVGTLVGGGAGD